MSGEAASRATPGLPGRQRELAEAALATGVPVVVVLFSGRPLMITWLVERARAVVGAWFLGDMAGQAIADVLTGRFNPTARLPVSWPREIGQIPIFYSSRPTGRPADPADPFTSKYLDLSVEPLFPFGHGLSFSRVELKNLRLNRTEFRVQDWIKVEVDAINTGNSRHRRNDIPLCARSCVDSGASAVGAEGLGEESRWIPANQRSSPSTSPPRAFASSTRISSPCSNPAISISLSVSMPIENPCLKSVCALSRASRILTSRANRSFSRSRASFEPLSRSFPIDGELTSETGSTKLRRSPNSCGKSEMQRRRGTQPPLRGP